MNPLAPILATLADEVATLAAASGRRVDVNQLGVLDRGGHLPLGRPGLTSPNGACRMFRAADGWMAVNLAREEDRGLVAAWLTCEPGEDPWALIAATGPLRSRSELVAGAALLGLPAAAVGEIASDRLQAARRRMAAGGTPAAALRVVDLSALWAGPLCGAVLAQMGAAVSKVECIHRPDPGRLSTPEFHRRLNGAKSDVRLDLRSATGLATLRELVEAADVVITSARPRALARLGLDLAALFAANPALVWAAVTGYGWTEGDACRVAFGDDAAAAGGLVRWTPAGEPHFLGDALADPITGLACAAGVLESLQDGGGVLVDAALARCAAGAASRLGPP